MFADPDFRFLTCLRHLAIHNTNKYVENLQKKCLFWIHRQQHNFEIMVLWLFLVTCTLTVKTIELSSKCKAARFVAYIFYAKQVWTMCEISISTYLARVTPSTLRLVAGAVGPGVAGGCGSVLQRALRGKSGGECRREEGG